MTTVNEVEKDVIVVGFPQLFGVNLKETTPKMVLQSFEKTYNNLSNNQDAFVALTGLKDMDLDVKQENLIYVKNLIMRHIISEQMRAQRYFLVESPFEHTCTRCHGTGELYEFAKKPVKTTCPTCNGDKTIIVACDKCNDEGRFVQGNKDVPCKYCKGSKQRRVRCINCKGEGHIKKLVMSHMIQSTTPCPHCNEVGFIDPKTVEKKTREKKIDNPVISQEAYKTLSVSDVIKEM